MSHARGPTRRASPGAATAATTTAVTTATTMAATTAAVPAGVPAGTVRSAGGADVATLAAFLADEFPQTRCAVVAAGERGATVRHPVGHAELRPGGTVSGPVLMAVADVALYVAILGEIGIVPLVVSTSLTVNFMRKPASQAAIVGVCKLLKLGRTLAVGEVWLYSEGQPEPVAHAVGTYAIPSAQVVPAGDGARARRASRAR